MKAESVGQLVKGTTAIFQCYRDGDLWYRVSFEPEDPDVCGVCFVCGKGLYPGCCDSNFFEFPVPVSDTGTGIFPARIKAITLMRWIRKEFEKQKTYEVLNP